MPYLSRSSWPPGSPGGCPGPHSGLPPHSDEPWRIRLLNRRIALQGLTLLHCVLELQLDLVDPGPELLPIGLLLDILPFGFDHGLFRGLNLGRRLCSHHGISIIAYHFPPFSESTTGYYSPCFSRSCLFTRPSSSSASASFCFSPETSAVCEAAANSDACVYISENSVNFLQ